MTRRRQASAPGTAAVPAPPRLVFDTALLLRALLLGDAPARRLRLAWQQGHCRPLIGGAQARELLRALAHPGLQLAEAQREELLADFLPYAEVVDEGPAPRGKTRPPALRLALAKAARADALVSDSTELRSGFKALLSRSEASLCRLLDSKEFLASL
ncbi:MAG: hypothetical protein ABW005_07605 [Burkholderiaceae bacterium]